MNKPLTNFAFIDSQNLNLGLRREGWNALDFKKFRVYLTEKYAVKNAYLFIGYVPAHQPMYTFLQRIGYVIIFKPVLIPNGGIKLKGNCDAELVLQSMIDFNDYEKAVIVSSDGDFQCLVKYLYDKGKLETVLSPSVEKCSVLLRQAAREKIDYLQNLKERLEYIKL